MLARQNLAKMMEMSESAKGATAVAKAFYESDSTQIFYKQVLDIVEESLVAIDNNTFSFPGEPFGWSG